MSNNNLQNLTNINDTLPSLEHESPSSSTTSVELTSSEMFNRQQTLAEISSNTFRELSKTLESEQAKLLELEDRRKTLQEEMLALKAEIEQEREFFKTSIVQSVAEDLSALNEACHHNDELSNCVDHVEGNEMPVDSKFKKLNTCLEHDEDMMMVTTASNKVAKNSEEFINEELNIEKQDQSIKNELAQNALPGNSVEQENGVAQQ